MLFPDHGAFSYVMNGGTYVANASCCDFYGISLPARNCNLLKIKQIAGSMDATHRSCTHECMLHAAIWLPFSFSPSAVHSPPLRMRVVDATSCNRCCWWRETPSELRQPSSWRGGLREARQRWQPQPAQSSGQTLSCTAPLTGCACSLECFELYCKAPFPNPQKQNDPTLLQCCLSS